MNRKILATAVAGAIAPMAAQALDVSVSGQVNRAIRYADNGVGSDVQHIDSSAWPSFFRIGAEDEAMPGVTVGGHIEVGVNSNIGWIQDVEQDDLGPALGVRYSYLHLSGDFGKISMGHSNVAGRGAMFQSHNGAWAGTEYSHDHYTSLGVMMTDGMPATDADGDQYSVWSFMPSINAGRMNTLRYDTPSIGPLTVSGSVQKSGATDHSWSFGANLSHDVGVVNVIGGLLLQEDVLAMSGGLEFTNGTSINGAWGTNDVGGRGYEDMYINVAHNWGSMSVAIDYRSTNDDMDMEGRRIGLGANYAIGGGVSVYLGFHNSSFDAPDMDLEDINVFHIGSLVTFN